MADITLPNTQRGGTITSEGWIPHHRHPTLGITMPVKLELKPEELPRGLAKPLRRRGALIYAMPCGREFCQK